jgi:signal transduction histidine kinase
VLSLHVGLRRQKSELHWVLLALLAALVLWSVGIGARALVSEPGARRALLRVLFLGAFSTPGLWLLLAARHAPLWRRHGTRAVMLPSLHANLAQVERLGERVQDALDGPDAKLADELADLQPIAEETLAGVERIAHIVGDMRRLSVERVPSRDCVDLREVVGDAGRLARLDAHSSPSLEISLGGDLPTVHGSAERLVQIVLNLIENARQALDSTPAGRIRVEVRADGSWVEIAVEDNGPGVPDSARERIFDPFFTTKGPDAGMGLGLAIAFDIAREHAGVLEERGRPGSGARFVLRLPASGDSSARARGQVEANRGDGQVASVDRAVSVEVEAGDVETARGGAL